MAKCVASTTVHQSIDGNTNLTEKKGKFIECYELDSFGTFIVDKDEDSDYFGALTPVMELYYKYVGRRR